MLGRKKGGGGSPSESHGEDGAPIATTILTDSGQEVTVSQFVSQLDETARKRLERINQRLRRLELQMETLEAEVGKASSDSYE